MRALRGPGTSRIAALRRPRLFTASGAEEAPAVMGDVIAIVLGVGTILVMAAYAVLLVYLVWALVRPEDF